MRMRGGRFYAASILRRVHLTKGQGKSSRSNQCLIRRHVSGMVKKERVCVCESVCVSDSAGHLFGSRGSMGRSDWLFWASTYLLLPPTWELLNPIPTMALMTHAIPTPLSHNHHLLFHLGPSWSWPSGTLSRRQVMLVEDYHACCHPSTHPSGRRSMGQPKVLNGHRRRL